MRVDIQWSKSQISRMTRGLDVVARTLRTVKSAEIYLRPRRSGGITNRGIANKLAATGVDPMKIPVAQRRTVLRLIRGKIRGGLTRSYNSGSVVDLSETTLQAVRDLARWLRDRISGGRIGRNKPRTRRHKSWLVSQGRATARYGVPPPRGICTGEFLASISARRSGGRS